MGFFIFMAYQSELGSSIIILITTKNTTNNKIILTFIKHIYIMAFDEMVAHVVNEFILDGTQTKQNCNKK